MRRSSPYYVEMVDQTTRGHQFLKKNLAMTLYLVVHGKSTRLAIQIKLAFEAGLVLNLCSGDELIASFLLGRTNPDRVDLGRFAIPRKIRHFVCR